MMKQVLKKFFALIAALSIATAAITGCASSPNQPAKSAKVRAAKGTPLKLSPSIKAGELSNGMKYYIQKNSEPQNRIYLRLAIKAGSVMETDSERGVAHFIEHLAFNGTEHFEKTEIVDWFEKIGMNFGGDLNAYTSFEETVYMLEIPADDPEMLKTAMLVLHDWASAITFPQEEIDKERGVIQEEWRLRDLGLNGRKNNQIVPFMMKDSVFENRMPIGKMDVINNITRDEILAFYKKWYRPEIMSVIVVGDAEVDAIENEIKNTMGTIPASKKRISVKPNRIPRTQDKRILFITDPEQKYPVVNFFEHKERTRGTYTEEDFRENIKMVIATNIINMRGDEITSSADAKWLDVGIGSSVYNNTDMFAYMGIVPKEGMFMDSLKAMFDEFDRAAIFGITESELQMVKSGIKTNLKNYLDNKDKIPSDNITGDILYYFMSGSPAQSVEDYCEVYSRVLETLTVEDINDFIRNSFVDRGTRCLVLAPEGYSELPSETDLMNLWANYKNTEITAYTDNSITKLMDKPNEKSKIKSTSTNAALGTKEYILENGIKIITKKTDFKTDEIVMQAASKGGHFQISDKDFPSYDYAIDYAIYSGFNGYSYNQIAKFLADKKISFEPSINYNSETITGTATNNDLEYLLQRINLFFTRRQYSDDAWQMLMDNAVVFAKNHGATPSDAYNDKIKELLYGKNDLRHAPFDMKAFEKLNPESAKRVMEERFANPADFTFTFVGDFDEANLIDLCQSYLGTMPTTPDREETKYLYWDFPKTKKSAVVKKGIDEKGNVYLAFGGELPAENDIEKSYKDLLIANQLASLLDIRLREVVREEKGGSYGIGTSGSIDGYPKRYFRFGINFGCEPKREEELAEATLEAIRALQKNPTADENIQKLREALRRDRETNLRNNWWWLGKINAISVLTYMPEWVVNDVEKICSWVTAESLQDAAQKYLDTKNYVEVFLKPER